MTERVKKQLQILHDQSYRKARVLGAELRIPYEGFQNNDIVKNAERFVHYLDVQAPLFHGEGDVIGFNRYTRKAVRALFGDHFGNLTIDYPMILSGGLCGILARIDEKYDGADEEAKRFYDGVRISFDACLRNAERYRQAAIETGRDALAEALVQVPAHAPRSYYEALIFLRFLHYELRINSTLHIGLGRFDQYMLPFYEHDVALGVTDAEILELTELFFISMNFDTDLYEGIQKGDNGQSMVLGGVDTDGNNAYNALTELCLAASEELSLIDPKINLRVCKSTPLSLYERGTRLTKQGLGFPQYSNDDVIIPCMIEWGYDRADAMDYSLAACWEVLPSGCGSETPNIAAMNFPLVVERAIHSTLPEETDFDALLDAVVREMEKECDTLTQIDCKLSPNALLSAFISPCIERGRDIYGGGAKYYNFGMHGAGISNAADALYALKRSVFDEGTVTAKEMLAALDADFVGYEDLRKTLLSYPKMGCNEDGPDDLACFLMDTFCNLLKGRRNVRGGIWRAGTGSAMEYLWSAEKVGALPDGKRAKQPFASSFSPSLTARIDGPLSAIQSFTKFDMSRIANGGPFTIEIHDTVFRNEEGEKKVAMLVKAYIDLGGHQMQLNAINRDRLLDAQKHPEKYPNLIVRVWGWSGYFNELDVSYQNHIIERCEYSL